jgi:short-subunit dehydrogenase
MSEPRFPRAVVTGASSGIGEAICRRLAAEGSALALLARRRERLETLAPELVAGGAPRALPIPTDVSDPASLAAAAALVSKEWPDGIDLVVASAGFAILGPAETMAPEKSRRMFETNVLGAIETLRLFLPAVRQRRGTLMAISSISGRVATPNMAVYSATKFALHGYLEALRFEVADDGIAVVEVCPGATETEFFSPEAPKSSLPSTAKLFPILSAGEVARAALDGAAARRCRVSRPHLASILAWTSEAFPPFARPIQRWLEKG